MSVPDVEVLLRVVDKGEGEDASKAGDVLAICPEGWAWSAAELTHAEWRIVRTSLLDVESAALLSGPQGEQTKRRREYRVDLVSLPDSDLYVGARTQAIVDVARGRFISATVKKP